MGYGLTIQERDALRRELARRGEIMSYDEPRHHRSHKAAKKRWNLDRKSSQCGQKEQFSTQEAAESRIEGLRRAGKAREDSEQELHSYACPRCSAWHIGHQRRGS